MDHTTDETRLYSEVVNDLTNEDLPDEVSPPDEGDVDTEALLHALPSATVVG